MTISDALKEPNISNIPQSLKEKNFELHKKLVRLGCYPGEESKTKKPFLDVDGNIIS